jgi:peroxiredoxin
MNRSRSLWWTAGIIFAAATVWINYEVKVHVQTPAGATRAGQSKLGKIAVGQPAPDFSAPDLTGRTVKLSDYRGQKVLLIDFWATWCGPCRMAMPELQTMLNEFGGRGLEILSVNQGESAGQAGAFMKKKGYGFHVLLDADSAIATSYDVRGIPTVVAVDRRGIVRWIGVGYTPGDIELKESLERILAEK